MAPRPAPRSPWKYSLKQVVLPRRVGPERLDPAVHGRRPSASGSQMRDEPVGEVAGDLASVELAARSGRVLDGEVGAEELVVLHQRPDHEVVDREPHGPRQLELPPYIAVRDSAGS